MFTGPFYVGQTVSVIGSPVDSAGKPVTSQLSGEDYSSSHTDIFSVAPDPATPGGAILTAVAAGDATLTESAIATEADGTVNTVTGTDTITVSVPPPPPDHAAALVFTYGTPVTPAAAQ